MEGKHIITANLVASEDYSTKALPFIHKKFPHTNFASKKGSSINHISCA